MRDKQHEKALRSYYDCLRQPGCDTSAADFRKAAALRSDMHRTDSLVISAMLQLIRSRGFPSGRRVGDESAIAAFVILLHYDKDTDNSILKPLLDAALYTGGLSPENYAWIADRRASWVRREEPYYYQLPARPGQPFPAEKLYEINRRRGSIGLPPFGAGHPF